MTEILQLDIFGDAQAQQTFATDYNDRLFGGGWYISDQAAEATAAAAATATAELKPVTTVPISPREQAIVCRLTEAGDAAQ